MPVTYQAEFKYRTEEDVSLTRRILPNGTTDTSRVNLDELHRLEDQTRGFAWNNSHELSRHIGTQLFTLLNGDRQTLLRALYTARCSLEIGIRERTGHGFFLLFGRG